MFLSIIRGWVSGKQGSKNLPTGVECVSHFLQWTKSITERRKFLFSRTRAFFQRRHQLFATLLLTAHNTNLKAAERRTMKKVHHIQHNQTLDVGKPPSSRKDSWKSFKVLFHAFRLVWAGTISFVSTQSLANHIRFSIAMAPWRSFYP